MLLSVRFPVGSLNTIILECLPLIELEVFDDRTQRIGGEERQCSDDEDHADALGPIVEHLQLYQGKTF
jgi:hypothetical protein